jgi:hypothetical protein
MAVQILNRRSSLLRDRPFPIRLGVGELALNNNSGDPGLYFADDTASPSTRLIKVGPTFIGSTTPNAPATGYAVFSKGESWLDTSSTYIYKLFDGTAWQTPKAVASRSNGKPVSPVDGQLHYDNLASGLFIYNSTLATWVAI